MSSSTFKFFKILFVILKLFSPIILIISLIILNYSSKILTREKENWSLKPIINISVSDNFDCPEEYEPLIHSNYKGFYTHCDCTYSTNEKYKGMIILDICEKNQGESNCTIILGEKEKNIYKWRGKTICVLRMKSFNYHHYISYERTDKICEINGIIDTENNPACYEDFAVRPINYFEICKEGEEKYNNSIKLKLDEQFNIYYSYDHYNESLVIDVYLTSNKGVCSLYNEGIFTQNENIVNKLNGNSDCISEINNNKYDTRYKLLDSNVNYIKTLKDNGVNNYFFLNIKPEQTLNLYKVNYFGINNQCLNNLVDLSELFENKIIGTKVFLSLSVLFDFIYCINLLYYICFVGIDEERNSFQRNLLIIITFILFLIISLIILYIKTLGYSYLFFNKCFGDYSYYTFWEMYYPIQLLKVLTLILTIFNIFYVFFYCFTIDKRFN